MIYKDTDILHSIKIMITGPIDLCILILREEICTFSHNDFLKGLLKNH